jgi:hypothetical protein
MESYLKYEGSKGIMKQSEGRVILLMEEKILAVKILDRMTILSYSHTVLFKNYYLLQIFKHFFNEIKRNFWKIFIFDAKSEKFTYSSSSKLSIATVVSVRIGDYFKFNLWIFVDFDRSYRV